MKNIILFLTGLIICSAALAQVPQGITNQGVVRDSNNQVIVNSPISKRVSILQGSVTGNAVYVETHILTTNAYGLITYIIGDGDVVEGVFAEIDWSEGPYFLKTETDPTGGTNYAISGVTQFLSVPYALHSTTAEAIIGDVEETDPLFTASPASGIQSQDILNWDEAFSWGDHAEAEYITEVYEGVLPGEMKYWDGSQWLPIDPPEGDDQVLSFKDGVPTWQAIASHYILPPKALALDADPVGEFSATINGMVNGEGFSTTVVFEWGSDTDYGNTVTAIQSPVTGSGDMTVNAEVSGLQAATTYHYRVKASSAVDVTYSEDMMFTTQTSIPQLNTLDVSNITPYSAVSGGDITYDGGLPVTQRGVVWSTEADPDIENYDGVTSDGTGIGTFVSSLTGLSPQTAYHVRAYAKNDNGIAYGDQHTFTTIGDEPQANTQQANDITEESAVLAALVNPRHIETTVIFEYGLNEDYGSEVVAEQSPIEGSADVSVSAFIDGLESGTTYHFRVVAENELGVTHGENKQFKTYDGKLTDIDGNIYYTVIIGDQEWMAENLRVTKFNNGDAIPTGLDDHEWSTTTDGAYAIYDHNLSSADGINSSAEMVAAYGKLYNWYAVDDPRGLCPAGWSIPTEPDWYALVWYLDTQGFQNHPQSDPGAGNALKSCRQSGSPLEDCNTSEHPRWNPDDTHFGFDEFGFSALPAGFRNYDGGFYDLGSFTHLWHSEYTFMPVSFRLANNQGNVQYVSYTHDSYKYGCSVRCFRDLD